MANKFKNSVIRVETNTDNVELRPVEFTHRADGETGWEDTSSEPNEYIKIVYLGRCKVDGDMFAAYNRNNSIIIFKGHINSGNY